MVRPAFGENTLHIWRKSDDRKLVRMVCVASPFHGRSERERSRKRKTLGVIASSRACDSSAESIGVLPFLTTCFGPPTTLAGLVGTI
jgi:hypothetical protein